MEEKKIKKEEPKREHTLFAIKAGDSTQDEIKQTYTEELCIALCGPIGSPLHEIREIIKSILENDYGYEVREYKLSKYIEELDKTVLKTATGYEKVNSYITCGNQLRQKYGKEILAEMAIQEIAVERNKYKGQKTRHTSRRICYLIDSLKNHNEYDILHRVYGDLFYMIGIYSSEEERKKYLLKHRGFQEKDISHIFNRDSGEEFAHGQSVSKTFPYSDYFLRVDDSTDEEKENKLKRFLDIVFRTKIITPTVEEKSMYLANTAASNSACLSRQVGAAITSKSGEVLSLGWNDVPKAGGGLYSVHDAKDHRCYNNERKCHNDSEKKELVEIIAKELISESIVKQEDKEKLIEHLSTSRIKDLLEFSRSVHAEMHALLQAREISFNDLQEATLYCTTYPCHNCARHIIAAGIKTVYYIEPYKKSKALILHSDSVTDKLGEDKGKVKVLMFDGIAPNRYMDFFIKGNWERKDHNGHLIQRKKSDFNEHFEVTLESIPVLEKMTIKKLIDRKVINATEEQETN